MKRRRAAGCMTGTSLDGLDAALLEIDGEGLEMRARVIRGVSRGFEATGSRVGLLRDLAAGHPLSAEQISNVARWFSLFHAEVVGDLVTAAGGGAPDLVCVHGQTVHHAPPLSWQLFNPAPLVHALKVPVVFDLRAADLAAGGQGAPITPLADWILFRQAEPVTVVNLGGFCNITHLPAADAPGRVSRIEARDVCACNQVLDGVARRVLGAPFDLDGRAAATGRVHEEAVVELEAVLSGQSSAGRSLGTGDEATAWIVRWADRIPDDLARCGVEGVARTVARACEGAQPLLLAGGGARNHAMVRRLEELHAGEVRTTAKAGVAIEHREAACMAVLGALCQDRVPITLPRVTGVRAPAPVSGCWMWP